MREVKVVMYESTEAASIEAVTGWVDPHGRFWGKDEHMARYCGSTHRHCASTPFMPRTGGVQSVGQKAGSEVRSHAKARMGRRSDH